MAGRVVVSTLNNDTGVLNTQNGMAGIPKAWVYFDGQTSSTATIIGSFNVSSVTRNSTGNYTTNFTTAMPNTNYAWVSSCLANDTSGTNGNFMLAGGRGTGITEKTTTAIRLVSGSTSSNVFWDNPALSLIIFSAT